MYEGNVDDRFSASHSLFGLAEFRVLKSNLLGYFLYRKKSALSRNLNASRENVGGTMRPR